MRARLPVTHARALSLFSRAKRTSSNKKTEYVVKMRAPPLGVAEYVVNMRAPALGVAEYVVNMRAPPLGVAEYVVRIKSNVFSS